MQTTAFDIPTTLQCKGHLIDISTPKVMGILNVTPDSFYDGGRYKNEVAILKHVESMLNDGASFLDIGAYSSRPGADDISEEVELQRLLPIVETIVKTFPESILSIDTFRSRVAKEAVEAGAAMINDISAGKLDEHMMATIGKLQVPYIMMHMIGNPQNMTQHTTYNDLVKDVLFYFSERIAEAHRHQIKDIVIDPGFGFSKTRTQNFELLNQLELLAIAEKPVMVGISRKSMIYKTIQTSAENALNGTTALHSISLLKGAKILRVHDVKEAVECVKLVGQLNPQ